MCSGSMRTVRIPDRSRRQTTRSQWELTSMTTWMFVRLRTLLENKRTALVLKCPGAPCERGEAPQSLTVSLQTLEIDRGLVAGIRWRDSSPTGRACPNHRRGRRPLARLRSLHRSTRQPSRRREDSGRRGRGLSCSRGVARGGREEWQSEVDGWEQESGGSRWEQEPSAPDA